MARMAETDQARSLARLRTGLAVAALVVPLGLFALLERQARRLEALADHGRPVQAWVTALSSGGGTTHYAYRVDGTEHRWNVAQDEAPHPVGRLFTATYLPEDPSFSRPIAERARASAEAAQSRSFAWKVVLAAFLFLGLLALGAHRALGRLRAGGPSALAGPEAFGRRLAFFGLLSLAGALVVTGFHLQDAVDRGQSVLPVGLALAATLALVVGVGLFVARKGPEQARARAAKVLRWALPVGLALAALRLVALALGH